MLLSPPASRARPQRALPPLPLPLPPSSVTSPVARRVRKRDLTAATVVLALMVGLAYYVGVTWASKQRDVRFRLKVGLQQAVALAYASVAEAKLQRGTAAAHLQSEAPPEDAEHRSAPAEAAASPQPLPLSAAFRGPTAESQYLPPPLPDATNATPTVAQLIERYRLFIPSPRRWSVVAATAQFGTVHPWARGGIDCPGGCQISWTNFVGDPGDIRLLHDESEHMRLEPAHDNQLIGARRWAGTGRRCGCSSGASEDVDADAARWVG